MGSSVYFETSVVSALFDSRSDPACVVQRSQTRQWYDEEWALYRVFGSAMVLDELREGRYDHQAEAIEFAEGLELLPINEEVLGVARVYMDRLLMPQSSIGDAVHLAAASVHGMDYLMTWNCRHLVNPNKVRHIAEVNRRLGLMVPVIVTPAMLFLEA